MGLFDNIGEAAKTEQRLKDRVKEINNKLLTATETEAATLKAELTRIRMQLAAMNASK